jgi:hypothetical protein
VNYAAGTNFFVEPSERTTSISTSSGEGRAGAVTGAKGPEVVTMLPSAYTIVMDVISMMVAVN